MITRVFEISDTATKEFYMVVQFEEIDKELCDKLFISPGFKIVSRIKGRKVETFAGYRFNPENSYENIEHQTSSLQVDGTIQSFGLLLSEIDDIKYLPENINLEHIRLYWTKLRYIFIDDDILEIIENSNKDDLRKILYHSIQNHIAIINIHTKEKMIDIGTTSELERLVPAYLWIPIKEITKREIVDIEISPFKFDIILPYD